MIKKRKKVILTGDFNFNLLKFDKSKEVNEFLNYLTAKWYTPRILGPTRLTEHQQPSLIDNIFLNFNDMHCNSGNLLDKISDHLPNFIIIEDLNLKMETKQKICKRSFENFDEKSFKNDIDKLNLKKKIESFKDINTKYKSFHENIMPVINKYAPFKELSNREIKKLKKHGLQKVLQLLLIKGIAF